MKKKILISLFAALTAGSVFLCSGCGTVDLTTINEEETTLSAEMEAEDLSDGTLQIHSIWYDTEQNILASATVTFSDEDGEIASATTDDSGNLEACILPGNTVITCEVTDSTGEVIASSEMIFKISSDYSDLTIYTSSDEEEDSQCILEIPTDQADFRAAIFLTEDGRISFANLTPWSDSYETDASEDDTDEETSDGEDDSADGETTEEATASDEGDSADEDSSDTSAEESSNNETDASTDENEDNTADTAE